MTTLAAALVAAQKEFPALTKDGTNPAYKKDGRATRYVTLDHLLETVTPILNKHGLALVQAPTVLDGLPALRTTLLHQGGDKIEDAMLLLVGKQDMQGLGGAITYARRYMATSMLGLAGDEDDDGNQASAAVAPRREPEPLSPAPATSDFVAPDPKANDAVKATLKQVNMLKALQAKLIGEKLITAEQIVSATGGTAFDDLSKRAASDLIERLQKFEKNAQAAA